MLFYNLKQLVAKTLRVIYSQPKLNKNRDYGWL